MISEEDLYGLGCSLINLFNSKNKIKKIIRISLKDKQNVNLFLYATIIR